MDVTALFNSLQATCAALGGPERPQAEACLQELAQTPYPHILFLAQLAWQQSNDTLVLFNAGLLLKKAIVRDWAQLDSSNQMQLHQFLFQMLQDRHAHLEKAALFQPIHGLCLLHKLWWHATYDETKGPENLSLIQDLLQRFYSAETLEAKRVGVELALNLIWEFSNVFPRCSELGLTWEAHELCRLNFQERVLPSLLRQTVHLLAALCQHKLLQQFPPLTAACLGVVTHALGWNFDCLTPHRAMSYHGREEATILTPPADWADLLLSEDFCSLLLQVQQNSGPDAGAQVNPIYLQLASFNGKIFGTDPGLAKAQKLAHFDRMLQLLFSVMKATTVSTDVDSSAVLSNACQAYSRLLVAIEPDIGFFVSANFDANCNTTHALTIHVMQALNQDPTNASLIESLDALLEIWVALATANCCTLSSQKFGTVTNDRSNTHRAQSVLQRVADVVDQFIRFRLESHGLLGDDETDPDHDKEYHASQLTNVAQLGRVIPAPTLTNLTQWLQTAVTQYQALVAQQGATSSTFDQPQDAILFVLQLGMCILADAEEGEQVQIPDSIICLGQIHERKSNAEEANECCTFVRAVLGYSTLESEWLAKCPQVVSPLVCKQLLQFLTRYVRSYLLPDVDDYPDFCVTYTTCFNNGQEVAEACIGKALTCLRGMGGESLVQTHAPALLLAVVKKTGVQRYLPASPAWRQLAELENTGAFSHLPGSCRRSIFEALCIGFGAQDAEGILLGPLHQHFTALLQQPGFMERCQSEDIRREIDADLERLRAVSRASLSSRAQSQRTFKFVSSTHILNTLVQLVDVYYTRHDVIILIIRCFDDLVVSQNMFSTDEETGILCEKCMQLLQAYAARYASNKVKNAIPTADGTQLMKSPSKPESLIALEEDEELETLQGLLDLLVHITQWDMLDFSGEPGGRKFDVGGACFAGLRVVLKLVTDTTLQYPVVCCQFFNLLLHLVEVYPDHLAHLDDSMFAVVLQAIVFAVENASLEVSKYGFRAIAAIALYHYGTQCKSPLAHKLQANFFAQMCTKVLHLCVECYFDSSLLSSVGQACWALFCVLQDQVSPLMERCLTGHPQAARIGPAFHQLLTNGDVQFVTAPKHHRTTFMANFEAFVASMRVLRMK